MLKTLTSDKLKSQSATLSATNTTQMQIEPHKLDPSLGQYAYVLLGLIVEVVANITSKKAAAALVSEDFGKLLTSVRFAPKFWGPSPIIDSRIRGADLWNILEPLFCGHNELTQANNGLATPDLAAADVTANYYARFRINHAPKFYGPTARVRSGLPVFLFDDADTYDLEFGTTATAIGVTDHAVNSIVVNVTPQLVLVHPSQLVHDLTFRFGEEKPSKYDFLLGPYRSPPSDVVFATVAGDHYGLGGDNLDNITKIRIGLSHPERTQRAHIDQYLAECGLDFVADRARLLGATGYTNYGALATSGMVHMPLIYPTAPYPDGSHRDDVRPEDAGIYCALTGTNTDQLRVVVVTRDRPNEAKQAEFAALKAAAFR